VASTTPAPSGSVGRWEKGARNLQADVETVQRLLETAAQRLQAPELDPKGVDGKIARQSAKSNTVAAIEAFQKRSNISITGLIEHDSQAWQALLQGAGELNRTCCRAVYASKKPDVSYSQIRSVAESALARLETKV
jgi:hypothetical protein